MSEQLTKDYSCQLMFSSAVAENAELDKTKLNSVKTKIRGKKDYLEAFHCSSADEAIKHFNIHSHNHFLALAF